MCLHHPFPDHHEVESYEQSEDAATVRHKRGKGECLLLFSNKNSVTWEHWHQLLYTSFMNFYLFSHLNRQKSLKSVSIVWTSRCTPCKNRAAGSLLSFRSSDLFHTLLHSNIPYCDFLAVLLWHRGRPSTSTLPQGNWHPIRLKTLFSTQWIIIRRGIAWAVNQVQFLMSCGLQLQCMNPEHLSHKLYP